MDATNITNGARDVPCFECRASVKSPLHVPRAGGGFHHQFICGKGLPMPTCSRTRPDADLVAECPGGEPRVGFQIGGYYSHMWFERAPGGEPDGCLEWMIASDGEFPTKDDSAAIEFHLCDFRQLERFVAFWGKELRRLGWVSKGDEE